MHVQRGEREHQPCSVGSWRCCWRERPGRVDLRLDIGLATREQAYGLYRRFFPDVDASLAEYFADTIKPGTLSPAAIQEHLVRHRYEPYIASAGIQPE
ncbi:hypothetical protein [Deinococcus sp. S9]|uniref:hypothetical protein n=1 Tax=Deinococcus sp. S9 TaxID=2545754 RepID=UPI0010545600|nr:hypothetical protein [Deinococcus sp. S9]TDE84685.1 hypothetical protein E0686_15805 [Deinococcus sp. S9]